MTLSKELLEILVCPESKQDLRLADDEILTKLNSRIKEGKLKNKAGQTVKDTCSGALIRKDSKFLYLIREDIPIMLIDESIPADQIEGGK